MSEVGFLGDGSVVLVVGEAPARATSNDGGRTTTEVPQVLVARLAVEEVEADAVLDERPTYDPETATWVQPGSETVVPLAPNTPSGPTDTAATPARGDAQNADQLQAEIDALTARKAALETAPGTPADAAVPSGAALTTEGADEQAAASSDVSTPAAGPTPPSGATT